MLVSWAISSESTELWKFPKLFTPQFAVRQRDREIERERDRERERERTNEKSGIEK